MRLLPSSYAARNLGRSPVRLVLSVLGSGMVVLLILAAGGFVRGMSAGLEQTGDARNVMIVGVGSEESIERSEIPAATGSLVEATVPGLEAKMGTTFVSAEVHVQLVVRPAGAADAAPPAGDESHGRLALVRGVTARALLVHSRVQIVEGRFPTPGADEVLAGRLAHTKLGVPASALAVGSSVEIDRRRFTVVGRLAAPQSVMDAEIWMPLTDLKQLTRRETDSCVVLTLGTGPGAAEQADIAAFCQQRLDLEITAMSESRYYSRLAEFFAPVRVVAWATAGLVALGGAFGGLNTMYAAFAARVRELGMLQCLGYRRSAIVLSMVQESCLATAAGAVAACAIGLLLLDGVSVRFSMGAFGLLIDAPALLMGLGAGVALGVLGALPPAFRCLRLPIPESLKSV